MRILNHLLLISLAIAPWGATYGQVASADLEFFEKEIRPILAEHCYECHGPEKQKADLRLDHIASILAGGSRGPALTRNDAAGSRIIEAVEYGNVDLQMPPTGKLSDEEIAFLRDWIGRGAPWPDEALPATKESGEGFDLEKRAEEHWAWHPIAPVDPPTVSGADWARGAVDRFILAKLEGNGLKPAEEADRRTLIRRLSFDLIGLPPTPEEIHAFVTDREPGAYERVVDRLLASPHFGERWARHWMDLVRYAETFGHEGDYPIRYAWKYRDYLIRAFNDDVPYDRLVAEHIAGDLLPEPRMHPTEGFNESIIGTGYWYMHQATHGPVDVAQDEADRIDNQIDVFSKAFLGMTVSCARCHDHKFDAISTKDYYSLTGYLRSSRMEFAFLDPHERIAEKVAALEPFRAQGRDAIGEAVERMQLTGGPRVSPYLLAAREVITGDARGEISESLFADFEGDGFDDWTAEGDAFGEGPIARTRNERGGVSGDRLVDTWIEGDKPTGTLRSAPFVVERPFIRFSVGGGNDENRTYVALMVDGEAVRKATGLRRTHLRTVVWDVSEFKGKEASIEIVDNHEGGWGFILADEFVLTDSPYPVSIARPVSTVASERGLDASRLDGWVKELTGMEVRRGDHPLNAWWAVAIAEDAIEPSTDGGDDVTAFEDFEDGDYAGWFPSGQAFTDRPTRLGDWCAVGDRGYAAKAGVAHSGLKSTKLQGVLRSPTFRLEHDSVHIRAAGRDAQIRLVIGQFQLREFNGLLFEQTLKGVNTDGDYEWHTMTRDLSKFKGRPAYIELIDEGDGYIAVDEIVFSNAESIRPRMHPVGVAVNEALGSDASLDAVAASYDRALQEAAKSWPEDTGQDGILSWLMARDLIGIGASSAKLGEAVTGIGAVSESIPAPMRVLAITEGTPVDAAVMVRGNPKNPADVAPRSFLEALSDEERALRGSGRLELVEEMFDAANPLPSRVAVNRIWHHLFGQGLVPSVDNFGVLGQEPTHPELLDHLAEAFRAEGWSTKDLIRRLVLTQTYRMSSAADDGAAEAKDPSNALLHRMNVRRLEGEAIRDSILFTAGRLDMTMYGESVMAYLSPFNSNHRRPPKSGPMDGDRRRTIYVEVRRNFLSPMLLAFDQPLPDSTIGRRTESNIPAQALILMNDPFIAEQATEWGKRLALDLERTYQARIGSMFETALGRRPRGAELARITAFGEEQAAAYGIRPEAIWTDYRVWRDLCHVMYTLKEFVYIG